MVQEGCRAGTPAGGSDGSWIQAHSADLSGMTSNGIAPNDGLYANDPWRAQAQPLPALAGQPASFAAMRRATTLFGTPQSAESTNSQQARLQSMTVSSIRPCKRHRHLRRRVQLRGNLLFLTMKLPRGLRA
eukprot:8517527-Pyramimonas_sp.AAC.1